MPVTIFYSIRDADADISTISFNVDPVVFLAADSWVATLENAWDIINPLINGQLVNAGFTYTADIEDYTNAVAAVISDVQEKAEFVFEAVGGFIKRISLPTFIETFFTGAGSGKEVDVTQAAVTAFNLMVTDGIVTGVVLGDNADILTDHGEDVTTFLAGHQSWGRNRR